MALGLKSVAFCFGSAFCAPREVAFSLATGLNGTVFLPRVEQEQSGANTSMQAGGSSSEPHRTELTEGQLPPGHVSAGKIRIPQKRQISPLEIDIPSFSVGRDRDSSTAQPLPSKSMIWSLESLKEIRTEMKQLAKVKQTIINLSGKVEVKQNLEESFRAERRLLSEEKKKALELLRGIQADIEAANRMEEQVRTQKENLAEHLRFLRDDIYPPLKDKMDELRNAQGLERLPNLHEEIEADMARYLEQRRQYALSSPPPGRNVSTGSSPSSATFSEPQRRKSSGRGTSAGRRGVGRGNSRR